MPRMRMRRLRERQVYDRATGTGDWALGNRGEERRIAEKTEWSAGREVMLERRH